LTQVPGLRVMARTSSFAFRGKEADVREIGARLNVEHILEGSVRRAGGRVRVTAQLFKTSDGYHLWSQRFDREMTDVFSIQDEISQAIVDSLRVQLVGDRPLVRRHLETVEAYQLYLRGRHQWNKWTREASQKAIQLFEEALRADPGYALAYAGLADAHAVLMSSESYGLMPREAAAKARLAALKALELDDGLAEAHSALGLVRLSYDWDWDAAEHEFRRALELNPNASNTYHWYSHLLISLWRLDESLDASRRALELNPVDPEMEAHMAFHYLCAGQYDDALDHCRRGLEIDEGFHELHWFIGETLNSMERYGDALEPLKKSIHLGGGTAAEWAALARAQAGIGRREEAQEILNRLEVPSEGRPPASFSVAVVHAGLGNLDSAVRWVEKAVDERSSWVPYLGVWPGLKNLRRIPLCRDLLRRLGLHSPRAAD